MLILQRPEIERRVNFERAFAAVERAYISASRRQVNLPPVGHITFPRSSADCHIKYGHIEGDSVFVIKIATGFPANSELGLPTGNGLSIVMSAEDGSVKALLHDEMWLTDIRTGIGDALASHAFARTNSRCILVVGTGIQAMHQIEAHAWQFGRSMRFVIWGRSIEKAALLASQLSAQHEVTVESDLQTACATADIIVTTTGSTQPLIRADWIKPGTHITAVGADATGKQELETELIGKANVLAADSIEQCLDHGELEAASRAGIVKPDRVLELGNVLASQTKANRTEGDITIADLTGIAAQDIAIAKVVLSSDASSH